MSTTKTANSKSATVESVRALMAGAQKQFPNATFKFGSTELTTPALVKLFQSLIDAIGGANAAQATATDAVAAMRATEAQIYPIVRDFRRQVRLTLGASSQALVDFGLKPAKARAPRTTEQRAATKAKLEATRAARGTTSKKQKLPLQSCNL
jgi:hypothetical protein